MNERTHDRTDEKIWADSGDSHLVEPPDLFTEALPPALAERMPRSVKDPGGEWETVTVDGQSFRRRLPTFRRQLDAGPPPGRKPKDAPLESFADIERRAPGANDPVARLADLDDEGIWAEVIYPSLGIWSFSIRDPELLRRGVMALNDWAIAFQATSPRYVCAASMPLLDVGHTVAEMERAADLGFKVAFFTTRPPAGRDPYHAESWEPVWAAAEATGMVIGFHIGTEPHDPDQDTGVAHRGPGGAVLNYVEVSFGGQRCAAQLVASGALERHRGLRVLVSEGGATWGPFLADRMDEAYRQHGFVARPTLDRLPSVSLYEQVYASFQHDRSAVVAATAMGWRNVMWGSDYPHLEGTFGHTQKTLHELFDDVAPADRRRITVGAFEELFPHVPPAPGS
ncbi:MAG TPA: amidohydrolase family protein [Acidimicrobiales bacterium]|nr:amidohydrolase family protein [Acidimicrobiales bacterium]